MNLTVTIQQFASSVDAQHAVFAELRGVSVAGMLVLHELFKNDNRKPSELAACVGRAATSFTPILDGLERNGFVCRKPNPEDRRSILIALTEKGESLRGDITAHMTAVEREMLDEMRARLKRPMTPTLDTLFTPFSH